MQRRLVLTNEAARHPFRQCLPPPGRLLLPAHRAPLSDTGLFTLTFVAAFVAFLTFLI